MKAFIEKVFKMKKQKELLDEITRKIQNYKKKYKITKKNTKLQKKIIKIK